MLPPLVNWLTPLLWKVDGTQLAQFAANSTATELALYERQLRMSVPFNAQGYFIQQAYTTHS